MIEGKRGSSGFSGFGPISSFSGVIGFDQDGGVKGSAGTGGNTFWNDDQFCPQCYSNDGHVLFGGSSIMEAVCHNCKWVGHRRELFDHEMVVNEKRFKVLDEIING